MRTHERDKMFLGYVLSSLGGMVYRFSPTTLAFRPNPQALYFPATIEVLVSLGFIAMGVAGFLFAVKKFAIFQVRFTCGMTWQATSGSGGLISGGPDISSTASSVKTKNLQITRTNSRNYVQNNHD